MNRRLGFTLALALLSGAVGCSEDSSPTNPGPTPLAAPAQVTATASSPSSAVVTWGSVNGAVSYRVERAEGSSGESFTVLAQVSATTYTDTAVAAEITYRYRVTAIAAPGATDSGPSNIVSVTMPAEEVRVATISSAITSSRVLHSDTVYTISGFVSVASGATLTIQPGTRIEGDFNIPGSSLFILRGARIIAEGTADRPIVFTSSRPVGERRPGDWGGVIIIGNGVTNRGAPTFIEGTGTGPENPLRDYSGGSNNNDTSGSLRYVRIEFAGFPTAPNEELNSLTMAAVGRGTTIEYVQVLLGLDDSFEWFGGAVDARFLVSYEAADDHFDASEGFVGRVQHMIAFQSFRPDPRPGLAGGAASDPQGIENDGCAAENCNAGNANRSASQPYTVPVFANFTLIGAPQGAWETPSGNIGMMLRRGTGGLYVNGVVARYSRAGVSFRGEQTMSRFDEGRLRIRNLYFTETNVIFQTGTGTGESAQFELDLGPNGLEDGSAATASLFASFPTNTTSADAASFDWTPAAGSPIATGGLADFASLPALLRDAAGSFIVPTNYRGAAAPGGAKWWQGWTYYARN